MREVQTESMHRDRDRELRLKKAEKRGERERDHARGCRREASLGSLPRAERRTKQARGVRAQGAGTHPWNLNSLPHAVSGQIKTPGGQGGAVCASAFPDSLRPSFLPKPLVCDRWWWGWGAPYTSESAGSHGLQSPVPQPHSQFYVQFGLLFPQNS